MSGKAKTLIRLTIASSCMLGGIVFRPLMAGVGIPWGELIECPGGDCQQQYRQRY